MERTAWIVRNPSVKRRSERGKSSYVPPYRERLLLLSVSNAAAFQVVGRKLDGDLVAGEDADEILAHFSRNVGEHLVLVVSDAGFHEKHRVWKRFDHRGLERDGFLIGQSFHSCTRPGRPDSLSAVRGRRLNEKRP